MATMVIQVEVVFSRKTVLMARYFNVMNLEYMDLACLNRKGIHANHIIVVDFKVVIKVEALVARVEDLMALEVWIKVWVMILFMARL